MNNPIKNTRFAVMFLIIISCLATLISCESEKNSVPSISKELSAFPQSQSEFIKQPSTNVNDVPDQALTDSGISEDDYQKYIWDIDVALVRYNIERIGYKTIRSYIRGMNYGAHPIVGEFLDAELAAYHGASYTHFGETYYQYYNFEGFIYMYVIYERTNVNKFFTEEYFRDNEFALQKTKDIRGDDFEYYDPSLTTYEKYEYILQNDILYLLDHENKKMEEKNKEENLEFGKLEFIKDKIIDLNEGKT